MQGRLSLEFTQRQSATVVLIQEQQPPWKVVRGFRNELGHNLTHLHNTSGGVLTEDELFLSFKVGAGSSAQVTTTGATRVYRRRHQTGTARCSTSIQVEVGATLEYLPDALIPFAGSSYHQDTRITLQPTATLFWWEIVSPGREASGERFAYDSLRLDSQITSDSGPIAMERILIEPAVTDPCSPVRLGAFPHWASFYVCRPGEPAARWIGIERELREISLTLGDRDAVRWGVTCLSQHGLMVRGMSRSGRHLSAGLVELWSRAKMLLSGHEAVLPRKLY
jgi:urease accessory protein